MSKQPKVEFKRWDLVRLSCDLWATKAQWEALRDQRDKAADEIERLEAIVKAQAEEIEISDKILADRKRITDLLSCPVHGECVPHAVEEIKRLQTINAAAIRMVVEHDKWRKVQDEPGESDDIAEEAEGDLWRLAREAAEATLNQ